MMHGLTDLKFRENIFRLLD